MPVDPLRHPLLRSGGGPTEGFGTLLLLIGSQRKEVSIIVPGLLALAFGWLAFLFSLFAGLYAVFLKLFHKADFVQTPLPILAIVMFAVGIQFLLMGLLAEMLVRTYHESQAKSIYAVRERIGFVDSDK